MTFSPIVRQLLVAGSPQLAALSVGGSVTYPSVLLQQFASNSSTIHLDLNTASWIGSIHGLAGIPSILMPSLMQWKGRKLGFIAACLVSIIGWIIAFTGNNVTSILISESFHGFGSHSLHAVSLLSMSEMVAPQYRNVSMVLFFVVQTFGMALVGILGRYIHWRTVSIIMSLPIFVAMLICLLWPESPSWLAYKGKFDECARAFKWLRGSCDSSRKELDELMTAQRENINHSKKDTQTAIGHLLKTLRRRDFYLPSLHIFVLLDLTYWSGSLVILIYAVVMIRRATHNEDVAFYGGIIMNCILFICVAISAVLIKRFTNKTVLLYSTLCATLFLLCTSVVNYTQLIGLVSKEHMICLYLLIGYTVSISLGVLPVVFTMAAELMPVRHRGIGGALYVVFTCLLHSSSLKLVPYLLEYLNLYGTLLIFAINATLCGLFAWKYIPETKGRTLQQLEDYYVYGSFKKCRENKRDPELFLTLHNGKQLDDE